MEKERMELPFRINCEGYFVDNKGNILALDSRRGYVIFPGGGVNKNETPEECIIRETFEETGAIIDNVTKICKVKIIWEPNWARTEKQKKRYRQFQGDEMHFFKGKIKRFETNNPKTEDSWKGNKLMQLKEVIKIMENNKYSNKEKQYRGVQLRFLKEILDDIEK